MKRTTKPVRILLLCLGLALLPRPASASDFKPTDLAALGAASVAKEACSAVFVSERETSDYLALASKFWMLPRRSHAHRKDSGVAPI